MKNQIFFTFNNYCVDSYNSGEEFGEWWTENQTDVGNTFSFKNKGRDKSWKVSFEPKDKVYLVYGIYSTGDSFGHSNGEAEILDVFETKEEAEEFAKKVNSFNDLETSEPYGLKPREKEERIKQIKNILGDSVQESKSGWKKYDFIHRGEVLHFPWGGYFEILNDIEIKELERDKD